MKTVLAFGDSLTWGSDPATGGRHPEAMRWPVVLEKALDGRARVIADGLRGRTTAYDEHLADCDRNGARILPTVLYTHAPVDLVVLMLGSNDMKPHVAGTAVAALQGMRRLVTIVRNHVPGIEGAEPPGVLIVAPPPLCETADPFYAAMFAGGVEQSAMTASLYADLADEADCGFFDAGSVARTAPADGVHMDGENTRALGKALAPMVHVMLGL
ncbi:SGNH/GDSL hydrolase family protein [Zhengella sp. ZM62]|uniref:SGNH/GDSL hydrolase family protein n=1 Tax=Zhengella sedimenti TaxID=3390035 RepID=UPI0039749272